MPSTRRPLGLDIADLRDMAFVAAHADWLPRILKSIEDVPPGKQISAIVEQASQRTGLESSEVEQILVALQNIRRWMLALHKTASGIVESIGEDFREHVSEEEGQVNLERWVAARDIIRDAIQALSGDHPLNLARKSERLSYAHQSILTEVRIITELRPVFTEAGDSIVQSVVVNTLLIDYVEAGQSRRLAVGLDAADVTTLGRVAQRAEIKVATIKEAVKDLPWQTVIFPDEIDS
jgi:hypothetical protein